MSYVVQLGHYAWLGIGPNEQPCITTSGRHAREWPGNFPAAEAAAWLEANRPAAVANSALPPRAAAHYRDPALSPATVVPLAELQVRLANVRRDQSKPAPTPAKVRKWGRGVTRQIYDWAQANPAATKADALAAFPEANPSTVGVQFGAARRAARG